MNTLIVSLFVRLCGSLEMKSLLQRQKAVSYFPHSTLEAVLNYVSRRGT